MQLSDFKTNEYAGLLGGGFEPKEENPMLGFRGASRYYDARYREISPGCQAMKGPRGDRADKRQADNSRFVAQ